MKVKRAAAIPLITHDPYFSIWSDADCLYGKDPVHWSGARVRMKGYIKIEETLYCFLGDKGIHPEIPQQAVDVSAMATEYLFENQMVELTVRFTSPLLLDDLGILSRPCSYIDFTLRKKVACKAEVIFAISSGLNLAGGTVLVGGQHRQPAYGSGIPYGYAFMGRAIQQPLGGSGDRVTADWGYLYLASAQEGVQPVYDKAERRLLCRIPFPGQDGTGGLVLAWDDLVSINYFGQWRRGAWTREYRTILDAIGAALSDREDVLERADRLDGEIRKQAIRLGGERYAYLCSFSYRQAIAAHKLIYDEEGNLLFLSKENGSNGCIGTVDVSYPSVPLFLLYCPELVKGMLRPVFRFASCRAWPYAFAPHDVGRYPYAWGQVYGLAEAGRGTEYEDVQGAVYPPFYLYPAEDAPYDSNSQMPVEECGNMLILTAAVCMAGQDASFADSWMDTLSGWAGYLAEHGLDPAEQLCTDDFAGHLAHNANLAVKAIMGVQAYSQIAGMLGRQEESAGYRARAQDMAAIWISRADAGDHTVLAFGMPDTWSLKYNLVWDLIFNSGLFGKEIFERELDWYVKKRNPYGTPLDNRASYTKSDWILWCAAMDEDGDRRRKLIEPVADYLEQSDSRVAFSDWYDTVTGRYFQFIARSVQGGIFMPLLREAWKDRKK